VAIPLCPGKDEQFIDAGHHRSALGRSNYSNATPSREVEQSLVAQNMQSTNHRVLVHAEYRRQVYCRGKTFALSSLAVSDGSTNLGGHLIVQCDRFIFVDFECLHRTSMNSTIRRAEKGRPMIITPTRQHEIGETTEPAELLIREARAASRRRRQRDLAVVIAAMVATVTGFLAAGNNGPPKHVNTPVNTEPKTGAAAKTSPYPATLKMRRGMYEGGIDVQVRALPWGTILPATQLRWIEIKSPIASVEWGVWRVNGDGGLFPVRSIDGGAHWRAAGPMLATDWVGGGIYFVNKVIPDGPSAIVMVSNAVIDVSTDRGRHWYQYLNPASDWIISNETVSVSIGIRIRPFPDGDLPKASYATYVLNDTRHEWVRTGQSVR
jgi:hypothetical protein